jgi:acetyl esterase/lipase
MTSLRSRAAYQIYRQVGARYDASVPVERLRASIDSKARFAPVPSKVEVQPLAIGELAAEWVGPCNVSKDRAILYLHGGAYTMGSRRTHRPLAARIAIASQAPALLVEYRLAPENPFPAALEDAKAAYRWMLEQGVQASSMVIAGDSAGGGLALAVVTALRDEGEPLPAGLVCLSPWTDLTLSGETVSTRAKTDPILSREAGLLHAGCYVGAHDPRSPLISPVFADLSRLPPLLIQVGEHEILLSDSLRLAENARQAGVDVSLEVWQGMWHVWHVFAGLIPEAHRAIERVGAFIQERMSASGPDPFHTAYPSGAV